MSRTLLIAATAGVLVTAAAAASSNAAVIFTETFDSGLGGWTANAGVSGGNTAATARRPASSDSSDLAFDHKDGEITRIVRAFTPSASATQIKLTFEMYNNDANTTQRSYAQLSQAVSGTPSSNGSLARIATNNNTQYQFTYLNGSLTNVSTGKSLEKQVWHTGTITYDLVNKTIAWTFDTASGQSDNPSMLVPNAVVLGNSVSNGTAGSPDTSTYFDNIKVEQFAPAAGAVANAGPSDGATGVDAAGTFLSWSAGANDTMYDVYFGTDASNLTKVSTGQTGTTYSPTLAGDTTYFWRVDPYNVLGDITPGTTLSFATAAVPEPASVWLLAIGAAGLVARRRRA